MTEQRSHTVHVQTGLRTHMIISTVKHIVAHSKTGANVQTGAVQPFGKYSGWEVAIVLLTDPTRLRTLP